MTAAVVVGMAATVVVADALVVVVSGSVVVLVVDAGLVEEDEAGAAIVVEVPSVVSDEAPEQDATRTTASNAVRRAKDRIRTGMDRISVPRPPGFSNNVERLQWQHSSPTKGHSMLFASAVPLRPGKTDRYRDLATELRPHLEEYQDLNRRFDVKGHAYWINHVRETDLGVSVYDISAAGLSRMRLREWDPNSVYDRWWLEFVEDVNGLDLLQGPAHVAPPEPVFDWNDN